MNKLKDFLYDKSDILIALLILLVAASLIVWRLGAIVEYPKEIISENNHAVESPIEEPENTDSEKDDKPEANEEKEEPKPTESTDAVWNNGLLAKNMTVTIGGGNAATNIVNDYLVSAGLFEDYRDFSEACRTHNRNPEQLIAGTYTFNAGSTKGDIVVKVTAR